MLLPTQNAVEVLESDTPLDLSDDPNKVEDLAEITMIEVGSGKYMFEVRY